MIFKTRRIIYVVVLVATLAFIVALEKSLDYGYRRESCMLCGAEAQNHYFELWGMGGYYHRDIDLEIDPLCRFLQERLEGTSGHQWEPYLLRYGGLLWRTSGLIGASGGLARGKVMSNLNSCPSAVSFLEQKAAEAPGFLDEFKKALRFEDEARSFEFFDGLIAKCEKFDCQTQPATATRGATQY
jgi:hypothetical protein